jgi:hypothetical protein
MVLGGVWVLCLNLHLAPRGDHSFASTIQDALFHWKNDLARPFMVPLVVLTGLAAALFLARSRMRFLALSVNALVFIISSLLTAAFLVALIFGVLIGFFIALLHGLAGIH